MVGVVDRRNELLLRVMSEIRKLEDKLDNLKNEIENEKRKRGIM